MTFKQFEKTVKHFRNDVIVSKHGEYRPGEGKYTLGIIFIKNEKQSKVYNFSGTYAEVLTKLNITEFCTDTDITNVDYQISTLEKMNGKQGLFTKKIINNTEEIEKLKCKKEYLLTLYKI